MNVTNIEWCTMTWNPVTGCLHGCPYCYAEKYAKRFGGRHVKGIEPIDSFGGHNVYDFRGIHDIKNRLRIKTKDNSSNNEKLITASFPFGFSPTFHRYRLNEPLYKKKPQNIFVGSMCDLFGDWVPDTWIQLVLDACKAAPQHRYLFLTKNPKRYNYINCDGQTLEGCKKCKECDGEKHRILTIYREDDEPFPELFLGTSVTNNESLFKAYDTSAEWLSIEPLLDDIGDGETLWEDCQGRARWSWVVIGAESGNSKNKIIPKREWIGSIVEQCRYYETPVYMKDSLAPIWGEPLIREFPWEGGNLQYGNA